MKIFLDTAEIEEIKKANDMGVLDGVTTNPTLVMKSGRNFEEVIREISGIVSGPVSAEVTSTDTKGMIEEARKYSRFHKNVIIKIPMIAEGLPAIKWCAGNNIRTNVTLIFSANQALLAAKAGAFIVSPFIGRIDDIGWDGVQLIRDIRQIYDNFSIKTQILAASIRSPRDVVEVAKAGADIATIPFPVFEQMIRHPLTDIGLQRFLDDWKKASK